VRRASTGDQRAIATIFERYRQELYGFCLGLLGEPQDAQDALQNTMVKVLRALPGEEREISLRPWLYRIAHNEAIELRRSRRPTQALDGYLADGHSSVMEQAEQREQLQWLLKDLADLPERQRTVLVMRELSGLDFAEIGAALDTSGGVVRQSLYEARRNLEQMDHGRGMKCQAVTRVLSGADRRIARRRDIRAHLRDCPDCRRFQDAIDGREGVMSTLPPVLDRRARSSPLEKYRFVSADVADSARPPASPPPAEAEAPADGAEAAQQTESPKAKGHEKRPQAAGQD
jgi:RNA polymerase sigma factor (sigma-70 family)